MGMGDKMYDAKKDLFWLIIFLLIIAIAWYVTGGPSNTLSKGGLFLFQPQQHYSEQLKSGTEAAQSGTSASQSLNPAPAWALSENKLSLNSGTAQLETNPQKEYIIVNTPASNKNPIPLTGMTLKNSNNESAIIGSGSYLAYSGQVNYQENIYLKPNEIAFITTGWSPIGTSFHLNKCSGYFEQFQDFYPAITKNCPSPLAKNVPSNLDSQCISYINNIPKCEMVMSAPYYLSASCKDFISNKINYKTCVEENKNDYDFYLPEWRINLNRSGEMWKNYGESVKLMDKNGTLIDSKSY